ncbi:two-component system response regulator VanR [Curtobacterium sp. PhB130]|uniref:response regulator transcription factor n=1 Tax=Curtobacterium sp. PhB130 TaxID=2485178 RepID=UPI000F4C7DF7|nr:response regulator transcription factor [Curtobacterium sp. PhB130]ROS78051.1 two-component system response regulator VanR [Curtobacterium sp. PhB130]
MRILIAEDETFLADAVAAGFRSHGWAVDVAGDGDRALELALVHDYDVLVLDRDLPGTHGDDVCRSVVAAGRGCRIVMLTAAARLDDRVEGFELGADDYLPKPFAFAELVVRVRALGRRSAAAAPLVLRAADIELDPARGTVVRAGDPVHLTRKQFGVLELLLGARGQLVSAEVMLEKVWDEHADPFTTAPRVTVSTLRRALGAPDPITTVAGVGYRIDVDA